MEKCVICKVIISDGDEQYNPSMGFSFGDAPTIRFCMNCTGCIDNYFCKEEIIKYKEWCSKTGNKVDKNIIKKIKNNTLE